MGTNIRAKISKKNPYWISKHRFYELKHYCLQYDEWRREKKDLESVLIANANRVKLRIGSEWADPTGNLAVRIHELDTRMQQIEDIIVRIDPFLAKYMFVAVTKGMSYTYLKMQMNIPCSKEYYYKRYRQFWWTLSNEKDKEAIT